MADLSLPRTAKSHVLQDRMAALRTRVWLVLSLRAAGWVMATALASAITLISLDYVFRYQDPGLRVLSTLAFLGALGWTLYRHVYLVCQSRWVPVWFARRVEQYFPVLKDRLASALEFLDLPEHDPVAGSPALRQAVIAQATALGQQCDFTHVVWYRPALVALVLAGVMTGEAILLAGLDPQSAWIGTVRLLDPLGQTAWPQRTHLELRRRVQRLAYGDDFEIEVVERDGQLPSSVRIYYRFVDQAGTVTVESEPMHRVGNAVVAHRPKVTRPFSYRVEGGDDRSMPWTAVELVEPAVLQEARIRLVPPEYTGWPSQETEKHIRALVGTEIQIRGRASKPLQRVTFCLESGQREAGRLEPDGRTFHVPADRGTKLRVERSGSYWLELVDRDGLTSGSDTRWEIRAVPDVPPSVVLEQPSTTSYVTPRAVVPLRMVVKDDLAIRQVTLAFSRSDRPQAPETTEVLFQAPSRVVPEGSPAAADPESGETRVVTHDWDLAPVGLAPGTQVTFYATATDYRPQTGKSDPRRLTVITPEELTDRIASRQAFILSELSRVLQLQQQGRQQVAALDIRLRTVRRLDQPDLDQLRGAELNQRQVERTLTSPSDGIAMHVAALLDELKNNKVDRSDVQRQLEGLQAEIERLRREHLPVIARQLIAAVKSAQVRIDQPDAPAGEERPIGAALAEAGQHQDQVIASLEQMLAALARWDRSRRFYRDLAQLLHDQQDLATRTLDLARRTLTLELRDLGPKDLADLQVASHQQLELARRLDTTLQALEQSQAETESADPLVVQCVHDALARARELAIGLLMRSAGVSLQANQTGQAMAQQQQAIDGLQELLDILANRGTPALARLLRLLREAESALADMIAREQKLQNQAAEAGRNPADAARRQLDAFRQAQQTLRDQAERLARQLQRLGADVPSQTLQQAAVSMASACQGASQGNASAVASQAEEASRLLQQAAEQLAQHRMQVETDLASEDLARVQEAVMSLYQRQATNLQQTERLDESVRTQGHRPPGQNDQVRALARQQRQLHTEANNLARELASAEALGMVLGSAAVAMDQAATLLDGAETGPAAQAAQRRALDRLAQVLEAVRPEQGTPEAEPTTTGQGPQQEQSGNPGAAVLALVQLKLLRILQGEINQRTAALDEAVRSAGSVSEALRRQYDELCRDQDRLAELTLRLFSAPESRPAAPPDPSQPASPANPADAASPTGPAKPADSVEPVPGPGADPLDRSLFDGQPDAAPTRPQGTSP